MARFEVMGVTVIFVSESQAENSTNELVSS